MSEEIFTIESLVESNNILQGEVTTLRNSNRILRTVHRALRAANESLRRQVEQAAFNDETFKQFCNGDFDAPHQFDATVEVPTAEGALPESEGQAELSV
jgi:FtsZ-binding cell division protein ZapB